MNSMAVAGQMLMLIGIFYVPGFLAMFGLRLKVFPALALAPAASAAIAGAASMVCLATSWRWSPASAAVLAAGAIALCFVAGRLAYRLSLRRSARRSEQRPAPDAAPAAEVAGEESTPGYLMVLQGAALA